MVRVDSIARVRSLAQRIIPSISSSSHPETKSSTGLNSTKKKKKKFNELGHLHGLKPWTRKCNKKLRELVTIQKTTLPRQVYIRHYLDKCISVTVPR